MLNCTASVLGINGFPLPLKDFVTCSIYCDRHPSAACALRNPEDCTFLCSGKVDRSRGLSFIVFIIKYGGLQALPQGFVGYFSFSFMNNAKG